mgnify:CR=1 FL=1
MNKFTKRQERTFMADRHPGMICRQNTWIGNDWTGMDRKEVFAEMQAEIELAKAGEAKIPAWIG